jgi:hypothetical protein
MKSKKRGVALVVLLVFTTLLFLNLSSPLVLAESSGCYVFPKADSLYCVDDTLESTAEADCVGQVDCDMSQHYIPDTSCATIPECEVVTCDVDCQDRTLGECQQLGMDTYGESGQAVPFDDYDALCTPGCCVLPLPGGDKQCQMLLSNQCDDLATKKGFGDPGFHVLPGMNANTCQVQFCDGELEEFDLVVSVKDDEGNPFTAAEVTAVSITSPASSNDDGNYTFTGLTSTTYTINVVAEGFITASESIVVDELGIVLEVALVKSVGAASLKGTVKDGSLVPLEGATILIGGANDFSVGTNLEGKFALAEIPAGDYFVTASKIGFSSVSQEITLVINEEFSLDFILEEQVKQGIKVTTYLDDQPQNGVEDAEERVHSASVYIDDVFRGKTKWPECDLFISLDVTEEGEEHTAFATYQGFESDKLTFLVSPEQTALLSIGMVPYKGECSFGELNANKDVETFFVKHALGKKQALLEWVKPCPEVSGYVVEKENEVGEIDTLLFSAAQNSYVDSKVEWGQTYIYRIKATYVDGEPRVSENWNQFLPFFVGDEVCEEHYLEETGWETFCSFEDKNSIYSCSNENTLVNLKACTIPGEVRYCSQVSEHTADCKSDAMCTSFGNPFGLYFTQEQCYGTSEPAGGAAPNFCYFDYSSSIVDQCQSCSNVESCFDYKSQGACEINNCFGASSECNWVEGAKVDSPLEGSLLDYSLIYDNYDANSVFVTSETGSGYCVEKDYKKADACSLCGPEANIFENFYCTSDVCSNLGNCFSVKSLTECKTCDEYPKSDLNCYSYISEQECAGAGEITKDEFEHISRSDDNCGWGSCRWQGNNEGVGQCVKDADADGEDDCLQSTSIGTSTTSLCKIDNTPPRTEISEGLHIISLASPNMTFEGDDTQENALQQSNLGVLRFCLTSANQQASDICTSSNFQEVAYSGNLYTESLEVDLINSGLLPGLVSGELYKLKYFSKDIYENQEDLQETFVFVDNVLPQFKISEEESVSADMVDLTVFLTDTSEEMECTFTLEPIIGEGSTQVVLVAREEDPKQAEFLQLQGVRYDLEVSCLDDYGNINLQNKTYVFNLNQKITLVNPGLQAVLSTTSIPFKVDTDVAASCSLYKENNLIANFLTDEESKHHETPPISGFIEGEYAAEQQVICTEQQSGESTDAYFHFFVDFTPPSTAIVLEEGSRVEMPTAYGWELAFVDNVQASFECDSGQTGFGCDKTYYCLGEGCELASSPGYIEFMEESVNLDESTKICYYSTDMANTPFPLVTCGQVNIEGYGITLEKPPAYYFGENVFGVSNLHFFDWQISTKVPTETCKFDFTAGFNFETVEPFKVLEKSEDNYLFSGFPGEIISEYPEDGGIKTIYVKCANEVGEIGMEQKMFLEYDPTAPEILSSFADPDPVIEGVTTLLTVETDDKTLCRFSDNSEGLGSNDYLSMEYSFPGEFEKEVYKLHEDLFAINFLGTTKDFLLTTQCMNGAGDLSGLEEIAFMVDYTALGNIVSVFPAQGSYFTAMEIPLGVETNKNAICEYKLNDTYLSFTETGGKTHSMTYPTLDEKEYIIPIKCIMGDHEAQESISFTIDRTSPIITNVNAQNYTCGKSEWSVLAYSEEESIDWYSFEVYDKGEKKSSSSKYGSSSSGSSILVANGTVGGANPIKFSVSEFEENHTYVVKVMAQDSAGNQGQYTESNGFMVTDTNYPVCQEDEDAPLISFVSLTEDCTSLGVAMLCEDETGCDNFKYGKSASADACNATLSYWGQNIIFDKPGWVCYSVQDTSEINESGTKLVTYPDADSDSLADSCDLCSDTGSGEIVDEAGCADGEFSDFSLEVDTDGDGLPDAWENYYDGFTCEFKDYLADSDNDGESDAEEDYDEDGFTNLQEQMASTDPCDASSFGSSAFGGPQVFDEEEVGEEDFEPEIDLTPPTKEGSILPWVFLILGLLMVMGGVGYLIYYYKYAPQKPRGGAAASSGMTRSIEKPATVSKPGFVDTWKQKMFQSRKRREDEKKDRSRKSIFGSFSKNSDKIPHLDAALNNKKSPLARIHDLAHHYADHKDEIKPGLKSHEKGIFAKLEGIAKKTENKKIDDVVSKDEANDIFSKLKKISKKRKGKEK